MIFADRAKETRRRVWRRVVERSGRPGGGLAASSDFSGFPLDSPIYKAPLMIQNRNIL